jgi:hypothetical protein
MSGVFAELVKRQTTDKGEADVLRHVKKTNHKRLTDTGNIYIMQLDFKGFLRSSTQVRKSS